MQIALKDVPLPAQASNTTLAPPFGTFSPNTLQAAVIRMARATILRRGLFRDLMRRVVAALRPGPLDAVFLGASFRTYLDATSTEWALLFKPDYNKDEIGFLAQGLGPGRVFVDIGANIGLYSLPLALRMGSTGRVVAIEPDRHALRRLRINDAASGAGNVTVFPVAIGARDGVTTFVEATNCGASRIDGKGGRQVRMRPLLAIAEQAGIERIDALKIDIEGYEDRALIPFFRAAPRSLWPKRIVIEDENADQWAEDCMAFLMDIGYLPAGHTSNNALLILDEDAAPAGARLQLVVSNPQSGRAHRKQ